MSTKYKILIVAGIVLFVVALDILIQTNYAFLYALFFLIPPFASIIDLIAVRLERSKFNIKIVSRESKEKIFAGTFYAMAGLILMLGFLSLQRKHWYDNFTPSRLMLIDVVIGVSAVMCLVGQIGHLIISLTLRFLKFNFPTYLFLFFLSYITCALSFAVLFHLDIDGVRNINPAYETLDIIYFSFVTLSTTGFGDMTPSSLLSKFYVVMENMVGLFLTSYVIAMIFNSPKRSV
jgi:Ion channel